MDQLVRAEVSRTTCYILSRDCSRYPFGLVVPAIVAPLAGYTVLAVVVADVLRASYQPAGHFWSVQLIEGSGLLALSVLFIAATVWQVHRRAA